MMKEKLNKSIRFKFLSVISIILFFSTLVLSIVIGMNERAMLRNSLMTKGESLASFIAKLSRDPLVIKDFIQLDAIVNDANRDEDIAYTFISDVKGHIITSQYASINYRSSRISDAMSVLPIDNSLEDIIHTLRGKESIIDITDPIQIDIKTIGIVTIGMSEHQIRKQIVRTLLFIVALSAILALVLGVVLFIASRKILFDPISELADAAYRVAKGDLSAMVEVNTTGEVQMLVDSFNKMLTDLNKTTVSKDYVDNIFVSMADTLIVVNPDAAIGTVNQATLDLLGYEEQELVGKSIGVIIEDEEEVVEVQKLFQGTGIETLIKKGFIRGIERIYLAKDRKRIPMLFSGSVMRDGTGKIQGIVCVAQDISGRKLAEAKIQASLQEKEVLLREIYHRVKNNLQVISSLLSLQARTIEDKNVIASFYESQARIDSMALIHEKLYRSKDLAQIDFREYVPELIGNLFTSYGADAARIKPKITVEDVHLGIDTAIPLGLIINEVVSNCLKHAFPPAEFCDKPGGPECEISVNLRPGDDGRYLLTISDNGVGFPKGFDFHNSTSLGMTLVNTLVDQLDGTILLESDVGTRVKITFSELKYR